MSIQRNRRDALRVRAQQDRRLTRAQLRTYETLLDMGAHLAWVYVDTTEMSTALEHAAETIRRALRRLERLGYLQRRRGPGRGQSVHAVTPRSEAH